MAYFEDSRLVNFENLKQVVDEEGNRIYSENLIQQLENGDLNCLNSINLSDRNNKYFMEPLLFAVKNSELSTYEVYKYYGEELQKNDLTMTTEIVMNEPDVLEDTAISDNATLMLYFAKINPEVILYMSDDLKSNGQFIEELCQTGNREIITYAAKECNMSDVLQDSPGLANNREFMKEAIKEDATLLLHASEALKNNYEFIKEVAKENKEVINYVAEHTEEFGKESINAAKEVLVENTSCRVIEEMKAELERVKAQKAEMEAQEGFDKESKEYKNIKIRERQLSNNIKFIDQIRNGEVKQERAVRIINGICEDMRDDYKKEFLEYIKMDDAVIEKEKVENEKAKKTTQEKEKSTYTIRHNAIESKVEESMPSKINMQAEIMEEILEAERTKEDMGVTKDDKEPNGERQ